MRDGQCLAGKGWCTCTVMAHLQLRRFFKLPIGVGMRLCADAGDACGCVLCSTAGLGKGRKQDGRFPDNWRTWLCNCW